MSEVENWTPEQVKTALEAMKNMGFCSIKTLESIPMRRSRRHGKVQGIRRRFYASRLIECLTNL